MGELIGFAELEAKKYIVGFGESVDPPPKLELVDFLLSVQESSGCYFESKSECFCAYRSSTLSE
jgi:hypothetical protein